MSEECKNCNHYKRISDIENQRANDIASFFTLVVLPKFSYEERLKLLEEYFSYIGVE